MIDDSFAARSPNIAVVISFAAGFCVWAGLSLFAGVREAWDTPAFWLVGLPLLVVVSAALGYVVPVRVWRWPVFIGLGQILDRPQSGGRLGASALDVCVRHGAPCRHSDHSCALWRSDRPGPVGRQAFGLKAAS